jgi:Tol biopolymer transport system component
MEFSGDPITVAEGIGGFLTFGFFSASTNGILAYRTGTTGGFQQLTWYDRQGKAQGTVGEPTAFTISVRLSPDGTRAAISRVEASGQTAVIWLLDFARSTSTRFTFGSGTALYPVWSPDGRSIIFASNREGSLNLYQKPASGAENEELLFKSSENKFPDSWSADGRFFLYSIQDAKQKGSLWVLPFSFLQTEFNEERGRLSPDGHWIAYASDESGRYEIYVRPFSPDSRGTTSGTGGKWLISTEGGIDPRWRGDGRELYYLAPDGRLMAVEVSASPSFQVGVPKILFQTPLSSGSLSQWDVTADGKHFLFPAPTAQSAQAPFTVVLNWEAALKK